MNRRIVVCAAMVCVIGATAAAQEPVVTASFASLPLAFEDNRGQTDPSVKFVARGRGYTLFLTGREMVLSLPRGGEPHDSRHGLMPETVQHEPPDVVRLELTGALSPKQIEPLDRLPGISNYFIGDDPSKWRTNIPQYGKVRFADVYPGIDLVCYGNQRQLEYDFVVKPGADPSAIRLRATGAESTTIDAASGDLVLGLHDSMLRLKLPLGYQQTSQGRTPIPARYTVNAAGEILFDLAGYDRQKPLVIDPVVSYSTYLGGSGLDYPHAVAVDGSGNTYVAGYSNSTNFPTASPLQGSNAGGYDAFIAKLNSSGSALLYSTYLGGSGADFGYAMAVDGSGNAYVAGQTTSANFPTVSPLQGSNGGGADAFIAKLNSSGSVLLYSTYLGGSREDGVAAMVVDGSGNAYVAGHTASTNFPTASPLQGSNAGGNDAFIAKLNSSGSALLYSTYLGGSIDDFALGLALDGSGNIYVAGETTSTNFPTASPLQRSNSGDYDLFIAKLNSSGSVLLYSTYLGGSGTEIGGALAVDGSGNAYVIGNTNSTNFPTASPLQGSNAGGNDAFIAKLDSSGSALLYSTYLGGSGFDSASAIAVDGSGNAYVAGQTNSTNFPTVSPLQGSNAGNNDVFFARLNSSGSALLYSTYLGGSGDDYPAALAVDGSGSAYVAGLTNSTDFPTASPLQGSNGGGQFDGFVAKISFAPAASRRRAAKH